MRDLEVVLVVVTAIAVLRPLTPLTRSRVLTLLIAAIPASVAVVQAVVEGGRWQLIPLWVVTGAVIALALRDAALAPRPGTPDPEPPVVPPRRVSPIILGIAVVGSAGLAWALPIVHLPPPGGPFSVGTTTLTLVDEDREERYGADPGGPRILPLQVWYPTSDRLVEARDPWLLEREGVMSVAARDVGLPGFALNHLSLVTSHAIRDAPPISSGDLPVVLYAHGWRGARELHATQLESLASHGYLVIAADHTYGAMATHLPDGTIAEVDETALPNGVPQEEYEAAADLLVDTFASDLTSILDAVFEEGLLGDLVALDRLEGHPVGLIGHSTGGGAAILACNRDPRCGAVVGYDPWVEPVPDTVVGGDLEVPLLSLRSDEWVGNGNDVRLRRLHAGSTAPEGRVAVEGINHQDLTLLPLLSPLSDVLGLSGPLADEASLDVLDRWTVRFLDHHLRGIGTDPLMVPPEHHHTTLEKATDPVSDPG